VKNIIIKAATAPYKLLVHAFGGNEDDYKEIQFKYLQLNVSEDQYRILNNIIKVVQNNPSIGAEFIQLNNKADEIEEYAVFLNKKQYLGISSDSLSDAMKEKIFALSVKDSLFSNWVDSITGNHSKLVAIHQKCLQRYDRAMLVTAVEDAMERRNQFIHHYLSSQNVNEKQFRISNVKEGEQAPRESIPRYLINFFMDEAKAENDSTSAKASN
jgi:hypothetical protein